MQVILPIAPSPWEVIIIQATTAQHEGGKETIGLLHLRKNLLELSDKM